MKLSVIIPVYNEHKTIGKVVDQVKAVELQKEIIIVDDGSSDGTRDVLRSFDDPEITVLLHDRNRGKGAAIRTGLQAVTGEVVVIQDADLEYNPHDFIRLYEYLLHHEVQVVYGSRILSKAPMSYLRFWLGGRFVTLVCNVLYGSKLTDEPTCYKMIATDLLKSLDLQGDGFEFCPEVTGKILRRRIEIPEIPIEYHPRSIEEGKKIKVRDGVVALWYLVKIRLSKVPQVDQSADSAAAGRPRSPT